MTAAYAIVIVLLSLLRLPTNAEATYVVLTAARDEHVIEVAQADGAVVFEFVAHLLGLVCIFYWIGVDELYVTLLEVSIDSD